MDFLTDKRIGNFKKVVLGLLTHATPSIFFGRIFRSEALVENSYFFRTVVLRKLFDIRFSKKHCNFSRVSLLVKMASKTVTGSTLWQRSAKLNFWSLWSEVQVIMALGRSVKMKIMAAGLIPKARRSNSTVKKKKTTWITITIKFAQYFGLRDKPSSRAKLIINIAQNFKRKINLLVETAFLQELDISF